MRAIGCVALSSLLLVGCQSEFDLRPVSDLTRDLRDKQVSFQLDQEVTVRPGKARVFLQDGAVVGGRNHYRPHCFLMIDTIDHSGFPIAVESFDVTRVQRSTVQMAEMGNVGFVAFLKVSTSYDGGTDRYHDGYHFWLESASQPAVMRLTCYGVYALPSDLRPPTLEEINTALGELGTIRVREADKSARNPESSRARAEA